MRLMRRMRLVNASGGTETLLLSIHKQAGIWHLEHVCVLISIVCLASDSIPGVGHHVSDPAEPASSRGGGLLLFFLLFAPLAFRFFLLLFLLLFAPLAFRFFLFSLLCIVVIILASDSVPSVIRHASNTS